MNSLFNLKRVHFFFILCLLSVKFPFPIFYVTSALHIILWFYLYYIVLDKNFKTNKILGYSIKNHLLLGVISFVLFISIFQFSNPVSSFFFIIFFFELLVLITSVYKCHFRNKKNRFLYFILLFSSLIAIWILPLNKIGNNAE